MQAGAETYAGLILAALVTPMSAARMSPAYVSAPACMLRSFASLWPR